VLIAEKTVTQTMKDDPIYQSKVFRGLGRIFDKEEKADRLPYAPGIKMCIERPRFITEAYKQTEGEPIILRRAKALAKLLDNMTLYILPHERIVGNPTGKPKTLIHYPELFWSWVDKAIDRQFKSLLDDEEREELHEIHRYWRGKSLHGMERDWLPEDVRPYARYDNHGAFVLLHAGHTGAPNFEKVFKLGLHGIIKESEEKLKEISSDPNIYIDPRKYLEQRRFLEAAIITLNAAIRFGKKFAVKAREMADQESDPKRRIELEEIVEICDRVPGNPPRTFHEAVQCYWFIHLIERILERQAPGLGERIDQILNPFCKKDIEEGRMTREEAQELTEHLILKMNEEGQLVPIFAFPGGGMPLTERVFTIGGQTPAGKDATNEVTYIVLDAVKSLGLVHPAVAFRLHKNTPTELLDKAADILKDPNANGLLAFFNDEMVIPFWTGMGMPLEDARNYGNLGCLRSTIPGKSMVSRHFGPFIALPKCLELALNQGRSLQLFGEKQIGTPTPDPLTFTSVEDVIDAYLSQFRFFLHKAVTIYNIIDALEEEWMPQPFYSSLLDGCIENGQDCRRYRYFADTTVQPIGQVTLFNSLAVIKKLVFDEKKVSMSELLDALKNNWEGREALRQMCINEVPKFGNDDDYVDLLANDVSLRTTQVVRSFKNIYGGFFEEDGTGSVSYYAWSGFTGPTPDGRKAGDYFNDGTMSPVVGTDKKGPTAVLKSVGKIDHAKTGTHCLNQKLSPALLSDKYRDAFLTFMRTFVDLGIHHIQFNIIDRDILLDAQKHPEKYGDLTVRVAGYSAYFVDLEREIQDQIMVRTEQQLR
jgi:formate C-acetyltransferase